MDGSESERGLGMLVDFAGTIVLAEDTLAAEWGVPSEKLVLANAVRG